jgi:hypothetical protein
VVLPVLVQLARDDDSRSLRDQVFSTLEEIVSALGPEDREAVPALIAIALEEG